MNMPAKLRQFRELKTLLYQLTRQAISVQYRGSFLGGIWLVVQPLMLMLVYGLVFSSILGLKWGQTPGEGGMAYYSLAIFSGLVLFSVTAEILTGSTTCITSQPNMVKKVVLPVLLLPTVVWSKALVTLSVSIAVLIGGLLMISEIHWQLIFLPLVLLPYLLGLLGTSWLLSALSVYLRDLAQIVPALTMFLLFLAPIFYPLSRVPESYATFFYLNPLTWPIESMRTLLFEGLLPSVSEWSLSLLLAVVFLGFCHWVFRILSRGFADVL